jgi:enamine deaminase RidA (YjgF/YER057c/UK114 family)
MSRDDPAEIGALTVQQRIRQVSVPQPRFVSATAFQGARLRSGEAVLGVVGFTASRPANLDAACPFVTVALPRLAPGPAFEAWLCQGPVTWGAAGEIRYAQSDTALFGIIEPAANAGADLASFAFDAYTKLFALADRAGRPHVLRVFNYLPHITALDGGTERYRRFNEGRHAAIEASGRAVAAAPAACALGTRGGTPALYFLASAEPGTPIENPRQVSAYHYPPQYGSRSPSFSRAMRFGRPPHLFMSGTASIVGHESLHPGDPGAQTDEILKNLQALFRASGSARLADPPPSLLLKAYIRHAADAPDIARRLSSLPTPAGLMMLQADICRQELLVEIEGFCALSEDAS